MRVFYSGFNLYGQFVHNPDLIIKSFKDCKYDDNVINLYFKHTYSVVHTEDNNVFLHGRKDNETHQIKNVVLPNGVHILEIFCSDDKVLFLTQDSTILKLDLSKRDVLIPDLIPSNLFTNSAIRKIACGNKINLVLTADGLLYTFSNTKNFNNKNVIDICAGHEHCLILDRKGDVYTFGRGSRGQLGHGSLEDESEPRLIDALAGIKISRVAAGGWHSCAISADGDLYTWGWNANGQLGIGKSNEEAPAVMALPQLIDFPDNLNAVDVACGNRHTVVLLDNRDLYGAGSNKYHQLGIIENDNVNNMILLFHFFNYHVRRLICGSWSTAVVVD